jgi:hypothetical protein
MTHQSTKRINFFEPGSIAGFDEPAMQRRAPMFFVGIQRDISPPLVFGHSQLQRMRVIVVERRDLDPGPFDDEATEPQSLPEVLPQLRPFPPHPTLQPRLVRGEILRGENDELYEKIGGRIRRLRRLVSGSNGEILDVADFGPPARPARARVLASRVEEASEIPPSALETSTPGFRALLPEPGQWRVVCFGQYKQMLAPQLAHPERLRDAHRLPCHVQVYELVAPQKFDALVAAIAGSGAASSQLHPLTPHLVMQLQLAPFLPAPPRIPRPEQRDSGMVLPGERLFRLQLASDPTADKTEPENPPPALAAAKIPSALKTSIPERFLKPWEFHLSREEALYDLSCAATFWGTVGDKLRRLFHCVTFRRELRKWQVLLNGRTADEQLWSVRPPKRGLTYPFTRAWARGALELAGYDAGKMLAEWEVFWRRKGL